MGDHRGQKSGLTRAMVGRPGKITENNGGLSPGIPKVVVSRSLGIISVDYRGRKGGSGSAP